MSDNDNGLGIEGGFGNLLLDGEEEVEEITPAAPAVPVQVSATPTTAKFPKVAVAAEIQKWFGVVCQAEDLPDYMRQIPEFHYKALTTRIETVLMKYGVFVDLDGRLKQNKKGEE